jgi:PAS domain S-box-containing protein
MELYPDLTSQKKGQQDFEEASLTQERFRFLVEQMPALLWTTDADFRITSNQGAGLSKLGLKPDQLVGINVLDYISVHSHDDTPVEAHLRALKGETVTYDNDFMGRSYHVHLAPMCHNDGTISGIIGLALDITEVKATERELEQSPSLLRATLESTADGILVVDREGKWMVYNQRFVDLWRIPEPIVDSRDEALMLAFVLDQLKDPETFLRKVKDLYQSNAVSFSRLSP